MALTKCLIFFVKCRQSGDYVKEIGCLTFPSSYQSYHPVSKLSSCMDLCIFMFIINIMTCSSGFHYLMPVKRNMKPLRC